MGETKGFSAHLCLATAALKTTGQKVVVWRALVTWMGAMVDWLSCLGSKHTPAKLEGPNLAS